MKLALGSLIAVVLLGLYVYAVVTGILVAQCVGTEGCTSHPLSSYSDGMVQALTLVGGLVSALVVAELAITEPGLPPMARTLGKNPSSRRRKSVAWMTAIYLVMWTGAGLAAYIFGQLLYPKALQPLTDLGQSWLGLAVAAGYTYFGIKPQAAGGFAGQAAEQRSPESPGLPAHS